MTIRVSAIADKTGNAGGGLANGRMPRQSMCLGSKEYEPQTQPREEICLPVIRGKGEPLRIAIGQRERPSLQHARKLYFAACGRVAPEFIERLETTCAGPLKKMSLAKTPIRRHCLPVGEMRLFDQLRCSDRPWFQVRTDQRARELRASLKAWAERFRVRDEWLMDLAVHHVCGPPAEGIVLFSPLENCGKRLVLPDWDPTVETWAQWRRRTERALEQYRQVVESQIKAQGLELTPERRQQCHFDWLAGDQICGWSQKRIATAAGADRAGVVRAIHKLARFLGLSLRPAGANRSQDVAIIASIFGRIQPS